MDATAKQKLESDRERQKSDLAMTKKEADTLSHKLENMEGSLSQLALFVELAVKKIPISDTRPIIVLTRDSFDVEFAKTNKIKEVLSHKLQEAKYKLNQMEQVQNIPGKETDVKFDLISKSVSLELLKVRKLTHRLLRQVKALEGITNRLADQVLAAKGRSGLESHLR